MKHADFVHLHNHSDYSLLDGASPIPGMVKRAAEMQMPALALTDHGAMFGAVEFYQEARKAGLKPLIGMEAYVTRGRRQDRTRDTAHHLVLLARDETGFRNLMRLSSLAFLEGFYYKPRVDHEILAAHAAGLLALSACPKGEVASDLLADDEASALRTAMAYRDMFGAENYFLEIQNHGLEIEAKIRERVRALAARTGLPIVATNDCHYLDQDHTDAQDVLICIQTGKTVDDPQRLRAIAGLHFRAPEEMRELFADFPEALRNTLAVAERCNLEMRFGKPLLPAFPLPEGETSDEEYLRRLAWQELRTRYAEIGDEAKRRFEYELDVICRMGFASYFLIVRDFIHFARSRGIGVGPGRGSVAGSLVAYALRITDIDPLRHGLIFERFLNPERVTMPDIDIDFDDLRRGEVIEYVKQKYGEANVTQIITFGTMGAKGVVRDVGRALGLAFAEVDRIAKMVPDGLGMTLEKALELSPDLRALPQKGPVEARLLRTARVLEGLARHASTHAAGVLITPGPLLDYVPLYRQKDESVTTQWDMKSVEKAGLLKMDFLGLRTLSVLEESVRLIERRTGQRVDLQALPMDDAEAYRVFQDADTVAIFQFESSGMRDYLRRLKPTVFEDLVAMNALYRPGPMENIPYFIDCKHGRQVARYEHPDLEPILKGTYGVFVYQEQVMQAANALAGFSLAQADELRRAMGKKLVHEMEAKRKAFIEGCGKRHIPAAKAERVFETMEKFAGYGFNKCLASNEVLVSAHTGDEVTIGELFHHRREFHVHALDRNWRLVPRRVTDVVWNGRKPVFELVTAQGKRITATGNHPFRTLGGWTNLEDLRPGDRIAAPRRLACTHGATWPRHEVSAPADPGAEAGTRHRSGPHLPGTEARLATLESQPEGREDSYGGADTVPVEVLKSIEARRQELGLSWEEVSRRAGVVLAGPGSRDDRGGLRRDTVARVARALDSVELAALANSDVFWDTVVSITPRGIEDTYDLTVEGEHNFVASGLIVHNSHSAAYALLAYQCGWLKAHHPAEFMAATMTSEMSDSARIVTLIEECRRLGLEILPPDVNRSEWKFTLEEGRVRIGLGAVRNVGQAVVESLVAARAEGGPFRDLFDLADRVGARALNRRVVESLVAAGACDSLGAERGAMFAGAGRVLEQAASLQRERQSGQSSLFGEENGGHAVVVAPALPPSEPWSLRDRSAREKEVLGFYFSEHPLEPLRAELERVVTHGIAEILEHPEDGAEVRVGGLVSEIKVINTRAGKLMAVMTLEDLGGRIECTLFPDTYEGLRSWLAPEAIVVVSGRVEVREERGTKVLATEVRRLEEARTQWRQCLHIEVRASELSVPWLEGVDGVLSAFPGEAEVYLHIIMPDFSRKASRSRRYRVAEDAAVTTALRERFPGLRVFWAKGAA